MQRRCVGRAAAAAVVMVVALTGAAWAEEPEGETGETGAATEQGAGEAGEQSDAERIDELEAKVDVLASELAKAVADETVPEEKLESQWGFGPAASKIYRKDQGLSIGGYGEYRVRTFVGDGSEGKTTEADALRAVLYVGYKFNDKWLVNSELELEHGSTSEDGSFSVEFATVDWQALDNHGLRAGLVLLPMGFVNEIHEPTFFFGAERPEVERKIIPSTWREVGGGVFGQLADGRVSYRMYGVNGLDATGFSDEGLRGGRQNGSKALADHWAFVGRTDVDVVDGLSVGGSVYVGKSGQDQTFDYDGEEGLAPAVPVPDALTTIYELHAEYKAHGLSIRGLFTQAFIDDVSELNAALGNVVTNPEDDGSRIAERLLGGYAEIAYDVLPLVWKGTKASLEPYFRYERLDTQNQMASGDVANENLVQDIYTVGIQIKPIPNVVFKTDYRNFKPKSGEKADQVQFHMGYVF
ncbi:MAG: hypothetical protein OEV20_08195 [Actinomycetota bacterium]|nr:hypothetical protein [Actinomycetota bacterium]